MKPLPKIRAERDQMSAIERRIADFILENAQLLRDYSSQQLAAALGISQSSVVKFSQKLGYRGYPDLKYSIAEAMTPETGVAGVPAAAEVPELMSGDLWRRKSEAEAETRAINPPSALEYIASLLGRANRVLLIGVAEDSTTARAFAYRLSLLGIASVHHFDYAHLGGEHRRLPRGRRAAGHQRTRQAIGAVPTRAQHARATGQGGRAHAAHVQSLARARGHRVAGERAG